MSQKTTETDQGLRDEGSRPIVYKVIRLTLPCHRKLMKVEQAMSRAHESHMRHSDVIEEMLDNWVSSEI